MRSPINIPRLCLLLGAGLVAGLFFVARPGRAQSPAPPPAAVDPAFYDYDSQAPFPVTETPHADVGGVRVVTVTYPSPVVSRYALNNTVTAYLFLPPGPGPHPAMVVLHEWNAGSPQAAFRLCGAAVRAGVAALMVVEPYSLNRRPHDPHPADAEILSGDPLGMRAAMRQAVLDARRGLDYLGRRPDIDPRRLGASGLSLGGILAGTLTGVDRRVKVLVTADAGADFARGFWNGLLTLRYRGEIRRRGFTFETFQAAMAPVDAGNWPRGFRPEDALLFNGRYDLVVRPEQAEALARALGGARIVWANSGHYGLAFSAGEAGDVAVRFLRARFFGDAAPVSAPDTLRSRTVKLGLLVGGQEGVSPVAAYQIVDLDRAGQYSLDGQLTLHGVSAALSARLGPLAAVGVQLPVGHGTTKPRPYAMFTITL